MKFHGWIGGSLLAVAFASIGALSWISSDLVKQPKRAAEIPAVLRERIGYLVETTQKSPLLFDEGVILPGSGPIPNGEWRKIGDFSGAGREQVWGLAVHESALYAGVGGQSDTLGSIWQLKDQAWKDVTPWKNEAMRVPSLLSSGDYLYAATNSLDSSPQIWRSKDGLEWESIVNFGVDAQALFDLTAYDGGICVGVYRPTADGEVWCSHNNWQEPLWRIPAKYPYELEVHRGALHVGTGYPAAVFRLDRNRSPEQVASFQDGALIVESLLSYRGRLVLGLGREFWQKPDAPPIYWLGPFGASPAGRSAPGAWRISHNFNAMIEYRGHLLASTGSFYGETAIWALRNGRAWEPFAASELREELDAMSGRADWIYNMLTDGDRLYVATAGDPGSPSIWEFVPTGQNRGDRGL